jgi:hypothetical protein
MKVFVVTGGDGSSSMMLQQEDSDDTSLNLGYVSNVTQTYQRKFPILRNGISRIAVFQSFSNSVYTYRQLLNLCLKRSHFGRRD